MKKNKVIAALVVICLSAIISIPMILYNCGCPHDWQMKTPLEKLEYSVIEADKTVIEFNEKLLPETEKQLKEICSVIPLPEWCSEVAPALQDLKDALEALEIVLGEAKQALELADGSADPSTIIIKTTAALLKLSIAYQKIQAIIDRH